MIEAEMVIWATDGYREYVIYTVALGTAILVC